MNYKTLQGIHRSRAFHAVKHEIIQESAKRSWGDFWRRMYTLQDNQFPYSFLDTNIKACDYILQYYRCDSIRDMVLTKGILDYNNQDFQLGTPLMHFVCQIVEQTTGQGKANERYALKRLLATKDNAKHFNIWLTNPDYDNTNLLDKFEGIDMISQDKITLAEETIQVKPNDDTSARKYNTDWIIYANAVDKTYTMVRNKNAK